MMSQSQERLVHEGEFHVKHSKRHTIRQRSCRFGAMSYHSEYNQISALVVEILRLISVLLGESRQRSRPCNVVTGVLYVCVLCTYV